MSTTQAAVQTVQTLPDARARASLVFGEYWRGPILPSWGSQEREYVLRRYDRYEYNSLWQGAVAGLARRIAVTPWRIRAPAGKDVAYYQDVFRNAWFGRGWDQFIKATVRDFCRHDRGAFWEVIGPGDPLGPRLLGQVTGLSLLDPLRCIPTGDPFYPVLYFNTDGELHLLHESRVVRFVDAPDSDEDHPGVGLCALSRAIAVCTRELRMGRYVDVALDDEPPPGIAVLKNILEQDVMSEARKLRERLRMDTPDMYGRTVFLHPAEGSQDADVKMIPYSQPPDKFDFREYTELDARVIALELGLDPQDVYPLSGGQMGTGTQSEIMAAKGKGNALAEQRTMITRALNNLLPTDFEFTFQFRDDEQDSQQASTRLANVQAIQTVAGSLSAQEMRRFLVAVDDVFQDILTDDAGRVTTLDDADPQSAGQIAGDDTPLDDAPALPAADAPAAAPTFADRVAAVRQQRSHSKAWANTRAQFVANVADLLRGGLDSDIRRQRFVVVMRAHLQRLGLDAFRDGLEAGGVSREDFDDRDLKAVQTYLAEQSQYIRSFADDVYSGKISPNAVMYRASLWANKSLRGFYNLGQASAAWNAPHRWMLGPTEEHCRTKDGSIGCLNLSGQVHRLRDWRKRNLVPGSDALTCKGYQCACRLMLALGERASGRF